MIVSLMSLITRFLSIVVLYFAIIDSTVRPLSRVIGDIFSSTGSRKGNYVNADMPGIADAVVEESLGFVNYLIYAYIA